MKKKYVLSGNKGAWGNLSLGTLTQGDWNYISLHKQKKGGGGKVLK